MGQIHIFVAVATTDLTAALHALSSASMATFKDTVPCAKTESIIRVERDDGQPGRYPDGEWQQGEIQRVHAILDDARIGFRDAGHGGHTSVFARWGTVSVDGQPTNLHILTGDDTGLLERLTSIADQLGVSVDRLTVDVPNPFDEL